MLLSISWYFLWPIFSATENTMRHESSMLFEKTSKRSRYPFLPRPVLRDWGHGAISHYLSLSTLYSLYSLNTFISFWMNTVTKLLKVPTKQNVTNCWFYNWVIENSIYRIFLLNSEGWLKYKRDNWYPPFLTGTWIQGTTASGSNSLENIALLVENTMLLVCPFTLPPQLPYLPEIRLHHAQSHSF